MGRKKVIVKSFAGAGLMAVGLSAMALAQSIDTDCTLVDGVLPPECRQPNAGTVVAMPAGENTEMEVFSSELGDEGFSISIDAAEPGTAPVLLEGDPVRVNEYRRVDRILEDTNVRVAYDGLNVKPRLAVSTDDLRSTYVAGDQVRFRVSTNYPAYINKAEVRVVEARNPNRVVAVIPVAPNGDVAWTMPATSERDMLYMVRVYDPKGRYDETRKLPISRSSARLPDPSLDGPVIAAGEGEDMTRLRAIPVRGGAVTVSSSGLRPNSNVTVMGEPVAVDRNGAFVVQRILPVGSHAIKVGVGDKSIQRPVEIPADDWFYIATADITIGRENGDDYQIGRVAGFAKGRTASGWNITAAIDTGEDDLNRIFRDLGAREPLDLIRSIESEDVYLTFGDDSTIVDEAPTSGKIFLKAERDGSHILVGDFQRTNERRSLLRSDRTLFGVEGLYVSENNLTEEGRPRVRFSAYAAQPDRVVERDVLDGTGGSVYFLRRQGILSGTTTVYVQYRDPVSGRVVRQERLVEGVDYTVNHFQGVVQLSSPLSPYGGEALLSDNALGRYDAQLVVQYEYVPTLTNVDGVAAGAEGEVWVNDNVRFGVSAQKDDTGPARNTLVGGDILIRQSDSTYLHFEAAQSEGPGFGQFNSPTGGLDYVTEPTAGMTGAKALAYSVEARGDLSEMTNGAMSGNVSAYYDYKQAGFVSADYNISVRQTSYGAAGQFDINENTSFSLAYDHFDDAAGKERDDARIAVGFQINAMWAAELMALHTTRNDPAAAPRFNGTRTDVGARLTYSPSEDLDVWMFAQGTVARSGGISENNRYGVGTRARLSDKLIAEGEISEGTNGTGGFARLTYEKDASTQYYVGYRRDPMRSLEDAAFSGSDHGTWNAGAQVKVSDQVTLRAENAYDLYGSRPSLATTYGVTYTPNNAWTLDGGIIYGEKDDPVNGIFRRRGFSFGAHYVDGEMFRAGISAEYHRETNQGIPAQNRETYGFSAYARYQANEAMRILADLDAIISNSDQSSFRDGRYIEGNLGLAYRPVLDDRLNVLLRYTYLEDLPGPDQVNIEGDVAGPRQKSHIFSVDVNYDLNRQWTVGAKYGLRKGKVETVRGSGVFNSNTAQLGILRLDYHVVHNWDMTAEARVMDFKEAGVTETGAVAGVWRHFGNNVKVGVGYQFGDVHDDLRLIDGRKEGPFLNIIAKF